MKEIEEEEIKRRRGEKRKGEKERGLWREIEKNKNKIS